MKQAELEDLFSSPLSRHGTPPSDSSANASIPAPRKPETVSHLTRRLRVLIEGSFSSVWVEGEISNFRAHPSGHFYFTLKDAQAQIPAVMFRNANVRLRFQPADGLKVVVTGSIQLYEPQGKYQIVCDTMEPAGIGALQLAFEQLKRTLAAEGLFDPARKKPLPLLPHTIGIITSPSGAAIRDMVKIILRRFPTMHIILVPVLVQGEGAAEQIAGAIDWCNALQALHERDPQAYRISFDVLIVGRGGGSIEDLWAFNEEMVARAIARSRIPIISAVGHETDVTIADFVADLRAPTPSAAAELVVQPRDVLCARVREGRRRADAALERCLLHAQRRLERAVTHYALREPERLMLQYTQQLDELTQTAQRVLQQTLHTVEARVAAALHVVRSARTLFLRQLAHHHRVLRMQRAALESALEHHLGRKRDALLGQLARVEALGPAAVLRRGYTITRDALTGRPLTSVAVIHVGQALRTQFADGLVDAQVTQVAPARKSEDRSSK